MFYVPMYLQSAGRNGHKEEGGWWWRRRRRTEGEVREEKNEEEKKKASSYSKDVSNNKLKYRYYTALVT